MGAIQTTVNTVNAVAGKVLPHVDVSFGKKTSLEDLSEARDATLRLDESQTRQALEIQARAK